MNERDDDRAGAVVSVGIAFMLLISAASGLAHDLPAREVDREIVRLQGYRDELPDGARAEREVVLSILGEEHKFYLTDYRRFRLTVKGAEKGDDSGPFAVQGERSVLVKIANARPGQRVTILGEQRASGADIFVLALDLCPPE